MIITMFQFIVLTMGLDFEFDGLTKTFMYMDVIKNQQFSNFIIPLILLTPKMLCKYKKTV